MAKIKKDYLTLPTEDYIARMTERSATTAAQPVFAAVIPKLAPLDAALLALKAKNTAYETTMKLAKQQLTERDDARVVAEELADKVVAACEAETADAAQLQSGGWQLRGVAAPVGPMTAPQNVTATPGDQEGEADLMWGPVAGRNTYIGEQATNANGPWTQFYIGKKSSCTATGLPSGQLHYFRFRAVGAAGPGPWSDITQCRAS